jgi:hypothetical protein
MPYKKKQITIRVRFEIFTAVTIKNGVFWDVTPCGSCKKNVSEELSAFFIAVTRISKHGVTSQKTPFFKLQIHQRIICVPYECKQFHETIFMQHAIKCWFGPVLRN